MSECERPTWRQTLLKISLKFFVSWINDDPVYVGIFAQLACVYSLKPIQQCEYAWNMLDAVKILWYVFVLYYTMYPSSSATFAHRGEAIWGRLGTKNTENTDSVCVSICCMEDLVVDKHLFWSAVHHILEKPGCP